MPQDNIWLINLYQIKTYVKTITYLKIVSRLTFGIKWKKSDEISESIQIISYVSIKAYIKYVGKRRNKKIIYTLYNANIITGLKFLPDPANNSSKLQTSNQQLQETAFNHCKKW